jgi:hypothetical protein
MRQSRLIELSSATPVLFNAFGDSISASFGVDPETQLYLAKTATAKGWKLIDRAISASMAADQSFKAYDIEPSDRNRYSVCLGVNDTDHYGNDATRRDDGFIPFLRGLVGWMALPRKKIARCDMTLSGSWSRTPVNAVGMFATGVGNTATAVVYGTAVYVFAIIQNAAGSEGIANVLVDGVGQGAVVLKGTSIGNTILGQSYSLACWRFGGLSAGAHTVQVVTINANTFFLDGIAGSHQPEHPLVLVGNISRRGASAYTSPNSDANVAAYNSAISTMVGQFQTDGLNVRPFEVHFAIDPATELQDGIHWTAAGHNDVHLQQLAAIP